MYSFSFYSPETQITLPDWQQKQVHVTIKRDDLIHPFISGNKWRKLKYHLDDAHKQQKRHLVTFGGAWSNHLIATACAGAQFKFRTSAFVRADVGINNPVLALCRLFGMELIFVDRQSYRDKKSLYQLYFADDPDAYFINEGGYGALGAKGCEEIITELSSVYDHIFVACGTGTTLAGISNAASATYGTSKSHIHGVPVLKGGEFIATEVRNIYPSLPDPILHLDYHFGGYGKVNTALIQFIKHFSSATGIMLEPVYTGKVFFAVHDLIVKDYFAPGDQVLILHTGGLTGFLGMYDKFE